MINRQDEVIRRVQLGFALEWHNDIHGGCWQIVRDTDGMSHLVGDRAGDGAARRLWPESATDDVRRYVKQASEGAIA